MKKINYFFLIILMILILALFLIRLVSPREIDDVTPGIPCENEKKYVEKSEYLWVVPNFQGNKISENPEWCEKILSLNKTLGMHGIKHTYREFKRENITQEELNLGIQEFEKCFGYKPEMFKPPNLYLNKKNKNLIKQNNFILKYRFNQEIHKVYHCNDTGILSNKIINWF